MTNGQQPRGVGRNYQPNYNGFGTPPNYGGFDTPPAPEKKRSGKTALIVILCIILALVIALGAFLIYHFSKPTYTVSTASSNVLYGTVDGSGTYREGESVTLRAIPAPDCIFSRWSDGFTLPTRTVSVESDLDYTAIFYGPVSDDWVTEYPADALVEQTRTRYRVVTERIETRDDTMSEDYTPVSSYWELTDTEYVKDVAGWPNGFDRNHPLRRQYTGDDYVQPYESETERVEVSEKTVGYIYYHWCRGTRVKGAINRVATMQREGEFNTFHAYYSTREPMASGSQIAPTYHDDGPVDNPTGGGAYHQPNNSCCTDSYWFYPLPVMEQSVEIYEKIFVYDHWSEPQDERPSGSEYEEITEYRYRPR